MFNAEQELKKWAPVLEHTDAPAITDSYKKSVTAKLLENTEVALKQEAEQNSFGVLSEATTETGSMAKFDPVLISLVRRAMPNLIAYDVAGVQPMSGPTGLIFAMKARFEDSSSGLGSGGIDTNDTEALFNEADTDFSGAGTHAGSPITGSNETGVGIATGTAEDATPAAMGFTIEKQTVTAQTRQLQAGYTMELAQDLKAVHGLDAESELANILSAEILAEINREVIRSIVLTAAKGAPVTDTVTGNTAGEFDLAEDADGRWQAERYQSLTFQIEREANRIAVNTRRGKGNFIICSANVASALAATGQLKFGGDGELAVDATGNTFAGVLNGRLKVYVDPYASAEYFTVGYKGPNAYDAGIFYCPYVPLTMVRAVNESTFQPKIAFKTRYGVVANPFVGDSSGNPVDAPGSAIGSGDAKGIKLPDDNPYYRTVIVKNLGGVVGVS